MPLRRTSQELDDLAGLLRDFGEPSWSPERVKDAFSVIAERSDTLAEIFPMVAEDAAHLARGASFQEAFYSLCRGLHRYLFEGILRNAGTFRHPSDPNSGIITFGGPKGQTTQPLLRGTPPREIEPALRHALERLVDLRDQAVSPHATLRRKARDTATDHAVLFYKDFSGVHPFYDGNGRIGRYMVSLYLHVHGLYVDWAQIDDSEGKFLKKLNDCLRRNWGIETYEGYLTSFWRRFVVDREPLEEDSP